MNLNGLIRTAATGAATAALYAWTALPAFAQDAAPAAPPAPKLNSGDTAWMLTSMVLVLMMTIPGLALFYGGMVRKKNVLSVLMQTFVTTCLCDGALGRGGLFAGLQNQPDDFYNAYVGGFDRVLLAGIAPSDTLQGTIPESVFMCFQMTFAIITPALIIGSIVDRMKFSALIIFMSAWLILVYVPIGHWVWGGGFLAVGRARLRRRHGRSHQRRHRRPHGLPRAWPAHGLRHREHGALQPRPNGDRRFAAVGRLVRLQRRLGCSLPTALPAWP